MLIVIYYGVWRKFVNVRRSFLCIMWINGCDDVLFWDGFIEWDMKEMIGCVGNILRFVKDVCY